MVLDEIVAEKLRALCQRLRPTDLADLAMIFANQADALNDALIRRISKHKFKLVKDGDHAARIERNVSLLAADYANTVSDVAPDAPDYARARGTVLERIKYLLP